MLEQLIARVFYARNLAHWNHWRTDSYSEHKALGKFYDDVIDAVDALVEAYQGAFELVGNIPVPASSKNQDILDTLTVDSEWLEKNHEEICKGNRAVANKIDELTAVYLTTIYKLRNLK
jgi:hypothetical protein